MSDQYARALLPSTARQRIFTQLNPCNFVVQDNCPSAAGALYHYLTDGLLVDPPGGPRPPNRPAFCPQPGTGFIVHANFQRARAGNPRTQLRAIISIVRRGQPGNHVVLHGIRPPIQVQQQQDQTEIRAGRDPIGVLAPDHYASLVKLGPPENDVFYADCSQPGNVCFFYPSQSSTHPGGWPSTIENFLIYRSQRFIRFEYTRGPYRAEPQQIQMWRSGGMPKQSQKPAGSITSYRPTDDERGLWDRA
jgi:hypothetical protein